MQCTCGSLNQNGLTAQVIAGVGCVILCCDCREKEYPALTSAAKRSPGGLPKFRKGRGQGVSKRAFLPCVLDFHIQLNRRGRGYIAVSSDHDNTDEDNEDEEEDEQD